MRLTSGLSPQAGLMFESERALRGGTVEIIYTMDRQARDLPAREPGWSPPSQRGGADSPDHLRGKPMRYMLLLYDNADTREAFFGPGSEPLGAEIDALLKELEESGELVATDPLADPVQTKTVRRRGGTTVVTDGPLAETKEHFGGYLIVDCENIDRAVEIATRWPSAGFVPLEVRPIMDVGGVEM